MWSLSSARVELHGYLNVLPIVGQLRLESFIQDQASWFVVSGNDFIIDAFNSDDIQGNSQVNPGDGRPLSLTLYQLTRGHVQNFRVESLPFWCNAVAESTDVVHNGMSCNSTNTNSQFLGRNIVQNTDGIDTYRSDGVTLLNWDVTTGDDCLAFKGNTTNVLGRNITCRGGGGIAFGSLGQYVNLICQYPHCMLKDLATNVLQGDAPSTLQFSDLSFINASGTTATNTIVDLACSPAAPCSNITFVNVNNVIDEVGLPGRWLNASEE
ncbi:pectin lyase fold/virulence factor [Boletus coccyginus]|nr:pectin lyase fold/virulence factor [Boletus coccyginus]